MIVFKLKYKQKPIGILFYVLGLIISFLFLGCDSIDTDEKLKLDVKAYTIEKLTVDGKVFNVRAYENLIYVKYPVDTTYQKMNIYIPVEYFENKTIDGFTSETVPIFFPNQVGGYMPSLAGSPFDKKDDNSTDSDNSQNTIAVALSKGYVVASPGARGRTLRTGRGTAVLLDLKAAIRYLKFNYKLIPGDVNKIISNGTSAGGALSTLLGATGNSPDYAGDLDVLGAAKTSDDIFAVSAYCPITNLDHADAAYEWQFNGVNNYQGVQVAMVNNKIQRKTINGKLSDEQKVLSKELKLLFPSYLNSLKLKNRKGELYTLDKTGEGNFKDYIKILLVISARTAESEGVDMSKYDFLIYSNNIINDIDFDKFVKTMKRSKIPPAFDALDLSAPENELFGDKAVEKKYFTDFSYSHSKIQSILAPEATIKQLNPMYYIGQKGVNNAPYWRLRHGTNDKDTSLAVSAMLALLLENNNLNLNYYLPWERSHSGDYDLPELFEWMKDISKL